MIIFQWFLSWFLHNEEDVTFWCLTTFPDDLATTTESWDFAYIYTQLFFFSVVEPAQVVLAPDNTQVGSGSTLMFTCLGYGMPSPSITWMKNGVILSSNSDPDRITTYEANITEGGVTLTRSFLKICNVGPSDEGQYSCVASNGVNSTSNFQMNISGWLIVFWHHVCMCSLPIYKAS